MRFNSEDIWHDVPAVKITDSLSLPPGVFRVSLSDFAYVWKGFPSMNYLEKCNRLKRTFNTDYFESPTVLTDALSFEKLKNTGYSDPLVGDGSGFIYIYTFEDNIIAGKHRQGMLWWAVDRYDTKLKVGQTGQNILNRVEQQLGLRTAVSEPPILLTALWTKQVALCERTIHQQLSSKRLTDSTGKAAKGGVEWFKDIPTSVMPIILYWVSRYRRGAEVISSIDSLLMA